MILRLLRSSPPTNDDLCADFRKMCNVFLHRDTDAAVIATKFLHRGIYYELDDAITVCETKPGDQFGAAVRDAFIASRKRVNRKLAEKTSVKDWPSLKAAKAKSGAQFQREWICVTVHGLNDANINVRMETDPVSDDVRLTKICNPLVTARLGGDIQLLKKKFLKWERA